MKSFLSKSFLRWVLPIALMSIGTDLQEKDTDDKGSDDVTGQLLVASAPLVEGAVSGNTKVVDRAIVVIHKLTGDYLERRQLGTLSGGSPAASRALV